MKHEGNADFSKLFFVGAVNMQSISTCMDVSVIICSHNRANILAKALKSLVLQQTDSKFSYEVLVVDNGSTDRTKETVEYIAERSRIPVRYFFEKQQGIAYARNRGVREALGKWIAIFDDDQLADPTWLRELLVMAEASGAACVGGRIVLSVSTGRLSTLGPQCRRILGETPWHDEPKKFLNKEYPCDANVIRRREVYDIVGPFDGSMAYGGQDVDFSRRAATNGFDMWYAPKAIAYHLISPSMLTPEFFKWHSLRTGVHFAYQDFEHWGFLKTLLACIARLGQAVLVNLPILLWAFLRKDYAEFLDRKCLIFRAQGYARQFLFLLGPSLFGQKTFFRKLNFRNTRGNFDDNY